MNFNSWSWRVSCAAWVVAALVWSGTVRADEEQAEGSRKAKGKSKTAVIQVDMSKLPPDLVRQLLRYLEAGDKKGPSRTKASSKEPLKKEKKDDLGAFVHTQLDKGLRGRALAAAIH